MLVALVVAEKLPGKSYKEEEYEFWAFLASF